MIIMQLVSCMLAQWTGKGLHMVATLHNGGFNGLLYMQRSAHCQAHGTLDDNDCFAACSTCVLPPQDNINAHGGS